MVDFIYKGYLEPSGTQVERELQNEQNGRNQILNVWVKSHVGSKFEKRGIGEVLWLFSIWMGIVELWGIKIKRQLQNLKKILVNIGIRTHVSQIGRRGFIQNTTASDRKHRLKVNAILLHVLYYISSTNDGSHGGCNHKA